MPHADSVARQLSALMPLPLSDEKSSGAAGTFWLASR
jgi:hypothetical protein